MSPWNPDQTLYTMLCLGMALMVMPSTGTPSEALHSLMAVVMWIHLDYSAKR
jgi:hypothetical protein